MISNDWKWLKMMKNPQFGQPPAACVVSSPSVVVAKWCTSHVYHGLMSFHLLTHLKERAFAPLDMKFWASSTWYHFASSSLVWTSSEPNSQRQRARWACRPKRKIRCDAVGNVCKQIFATKNCKSRPYTVHTRRYQKRWGNKCLIRKKDRIKEYNPSKNEDDEVAFAVVHDGIRGQDDNGFHPSWRRSQYSSYYWSLHSRFWIITRYRSCRFPTCSRRRRWNQEGYTLLTSAIIRYGLTVFKQRLAK